MYIGCYINCHKNELRYITEMISISFIFIFHIFSCKNSLLKCVSYMVCRGLIQTRLNHKTSLSEIIYFQNLTLRVRSSLSRCEPNAFCSRPQNSQFVENLPSLLNMCIYPIRNALSRSQRYGTITSVCFQDVNSYKNFQVLILFS